MSDTTRETVKKIFEQLKIETDIKWVNQLTSQNDALLKQISIWNSEIKTAKESDIYQKGEKNLIIISSIKNIEKLEEERKLNIITEIEKILQNSRTIKY